MIKEPGTLLLYHDSPFPLTETGSNIRPNSLSLSSSCVRQQTGTRTRPELGRPKTTDEP